MEIKGFISRLNMRKKRKGSLGNFWRVGLGKGCCYIGGVGDGNVGLKYEKERNRLER